MSDCKTCKYRSGDCGHHFESVKGERDMTIPAEHSCDRYGYCMFWKPSIESRQEEIRKLHNLIEKYINRINVLENEIQRDKDEEERMKKAKDGMVIQCCFVDDLYKVKEADESGEH